MTIASEHGRFGGTESTPDKERVLRNASEIDTLQKYGLDRIRAASTSTQLWDAPWLLRILTAWKLLGEETEMRGWVAQNTQDDSRLVRVLGLLVGTEYRGGSIRSRRPVMSTKLIRDLFNTSTLAERVTRALEEPKWSEDERVVMQVILDCLRVKDAEAEDHGYAERHYVS